MQLPDVRRIGVIACGLLAILLAAAWLGPSWLDAGRFRATLEEISTAALGQPVDIAGDLAFTLLPAPLLTATRVSLGDTAAAAPVTADELRLRVAILPLLAGRIEARDLVLRGAQISLPWPLPADQTQLTLPVWTAGFAGRIERSRLVLGPHEWHDIEATLAASDDGALSISGTSKHIGREAQFAIRFGARARDGSAALEASLDGRGPLAGSGLAINGQIGPDASFDGRLNIRTADLSTWLPAPVMAARVQGPLRFVRGALSADDLTVDTASGPAHVSLAIDWQDGPRVGLRITAAQLDLDAWRAPLRQLRQAGLPIQLNIDIGAASFAGGLLRQLQGDAAWREGKLHVRAGNVTLPGDATLVFAGQVDLNETAPSFQGDSRLTASDLRTTLRWLETATGSVFPGLPDGVPRSADLQARLQIGAGLLQATELHGALDGFPLAGAVTWRRDQNPAIAANLAFAHVQLDPWLAGRAAGLPELARQLAGPTTELRLAADTASFGGHTITDLRLDVDRAGGTVHVRRLAGIVNGIQAAGSATIAEDGRLADARLELTANDATPVAQWLPREWRATPVFWAGRLAARLEGAGHGDALNLRIQGDIGDLRFDAQPVWDLAGGRVAGRVSLRHPGATRLLAELGLAYATGAGEMPQWPGEGSLSAQATGAILTERINLEQFDITAGGLRASGQIALDWGGAEPVIGGRILAETLPLPWPTTPPTLTGPARLARATLQLQAEQVLVGHISIAQQLACTVNLAERVLRLLPCAARVANGVVNVDADWNTVADPPRLSLQATLEGASLAGVPPDQTVASQPLEIVPFALAAGQIDGTLQLTAYGHGLAALRATADGQVDLRLRDARLPGFDLPAINRTLDQAMERSATATETDLRAALSAGSTPFAEITVHADAARGSLTLRRADANGPAGAATLAGNIGLLDGTVDLVLTVQPPDRTLANMTVHLTGASIAPTRTQDLTGVLRWLAERPR